MAPLQEAQLMPSIAIVAILIAMRFINTIGKLVQLESNYPVTYDIIIRKVLCYMCGKCGSVHELANKTEDPDRDY